ncbi:MAG: hypothetical protein WBV82_10705 [Myxococcaceae bacterium]
MNLPTPLATVLLDPPTALLFGCGIALVSARLIARNPQTEMLRTGLIGAGWGLFYGLCVAWFFFERPDWMFAYLKDAREVSLLPAFLVFVFILAMHGAIGALAGGALLVRGRRALAWALTAGAMVTLGGGFWLQWRAYVLLGTYEAFHAGQAVALQSDAAMQRAMNLSGLATAVSAIALFVLRFLQSRKLSAAEAGQSPSA